MLANPLMRKGLGFCIIFAILASPLIVYSQENHNESGIESVEDGTESRESEEESQEIMLPSLDEWQEMDLNNRVRLLVAAIYNANKNGQTIKLADIERLLGQSQDQEDLGDGKERQIFQLEGDGHPIKVSLVYDEKKDAYIEALARQDLEEASVVNQEIFDQAGKLMQDNYHNHEVTYYDQVEKILGSPQSHSYIYDVCVYHYAGEAGDEYALTLEDEVVTDLNYKSGDQEARQEVIDRSRKDFDRLSHEAGLSPKKIVSIMGPPMSINYDSTTGIVTNAWFSNSDDSLVKEVYYYHAYDGISIGLAYN